MELINSLKWRYATKRYNPTKKVSQEDLDKIIEAARLAPTSSGLQQFRVIIIKNQELKEKIVPIAWGQQIMSECSHILVFAAWDRYTEERIDEMYDFTTEERSLPKGRFSAYTDKLKSEYLPQTAEENFIHTAKQSYIGLGLAIAQAASLNIDSTPVEGFSADALEDLLDLKAKGLRSVTILTLGYRDSENDWLAHLKKVRIPTEEFVIKHD
jgi:nitroreductase/dihydropteridine reductase